MEAIDQNARGDVGRCRARDRHGGSRPHDEPALPASSRREASLPRSRLGRSCGRTRAPPRRAHRPAPLAPPLRSAKAPPAPPLYPAAVAPRRLPRREPPPSVTSGDYSRRDQGWDYLDSLPTSASLREASRGASLLPRLLREATRAATRAGTTWTACPRRLRSAKPPAARASSLGYFGRLLAPRPGQGLPGHTPKGIAEG